MKNIVLGLIVINVAMFGLQQFQDEWLTRHLALWAVGEYRFADVPFTVGFEPWQIISCAFLHGGVAHLALNMYGLWSFGLTVQSHLGARRFLVLYFASVVTSSLVQLAYVTATVEDRLVPTVGASGGVLGVVLTFALLFPQSRVLLVIPPIPMKAWIMVLVFAAVELVTGVTGTLQGIAHFAHLGGMLGALLVMLAWRRRLPWPIRRNEHGQ